MKHGNVLRMFNLQKYVLISIDNLIWAIGMTLPPAQQMTLYNKTLSPPHLSQHCLKIGLLNTMVTFFCYFSLIFAIFGCRGKISFFPKKNICPLHEKYYGLELHLSFFCRQLPDDVVELCINAGPGESFTQEMKIVGRKWQRECS